MEYFKDNHCMGNTVTGFVMQVCDQTDPDIKALTKRDAMTTPIRIMCVGGRGDSTKNDPTKEANCGVREKRSSRVRCP